MSPHLRLEDSVEAPEADFLKHIIVCASAQGMVMVDEKLKPKASWEFQAEVAVLTHSTTIQPRYQARCCLKA